MARILDMNEQDETNIAKAIVKFVSEVGDVYERARLMRSIVSIGDVAATPGFIEHLLSHVNANMNGKDSGSGVRAKSGGKQLCKAIETPFAADCILWTGAAVIGDSVQQQLAQQGETSHPQSPSSDMVTVYDEDRIDTEKQ